MADLIFSRRPNAAPMSREDVARLAPAAFTAGQADHLTERYGQVTTANAIDMLEDYGFRPVQAAQVRGRTVEKNRFATHLIAFAQDNALQGEARPELILYNSHDGQSSLKLFAGAFRFICSNGIVAGDGFSAKMRHTHGTANRFEDMISETAESLPRLMDNIRRMSETRISPAAEIELAYNAAKLRWEMLEEQDQAARYAGELRGSFITERGIASLTRPRRYGDNEATAWGAFNRVQEAVLRGGVSVASFTDKSPMGSLRRARAIQSVSGNVNTNRQLWDMAGQTFEIELEAA